MAVGAAVMLGVTVGRVESTWSFSAFTVLVYYALTHLAALRLPPVQRRHPVWIPWVGLAGCLGLAFWVEPWTWAMGLGLLATGLMGRALVRTAFDRA